MQINGYGNYLITKNILSEYAVRQALDKAQQNNCSLISYLIQEKIVDYKIIATTTAQYFSLPMANLGITDNNNLPLNLVAKDIIKQYEILPLKQENNTLQIAITDPTQTQILDEIKFYTNLEIQPVIVAYDQLINLINNILHTNHDNEDNHIINFVNNIINNAISKNASDIHFEPYQNSYRIRFRIDGILHTISENDKKLADRITARLKIMAKLDISERRLPQDGRFSMQLSSKQTRDCRINTCPTLFGEKIVIRILNSNNSALKINELGLEEEQLALLQQAIRQPQGMILVTGPTGSGKTVSLYAALNTINTVEKNISTVEDPIEINLNGINQVNVNTKIGLDFAIALRAFLRQDPDIIMIGEIRDLETANIAVKASQTGHLVLSTLHTNSAQETIVRLENMGVASFNLNSSLSLIIAQRLARKLCPHCKKEQHLSKEILIEQGFKETELATLKIYAAQGCEQCSKGYRGRIGIFEIMAPPLREPQQLLRMSALNKVRLGLTSLEEINRVI